jgi:hypothetical protein
MDGLGAQSDETYLQQHPNDETRFFFPLEEGPWRDTEDAELSRRLRSAG